MATLKLKCSDGRVFTVDDRLAACSSWIKARVNELDEGLVTEEILEVQFFTGDIFEKVITWIEHHPEEDTEQFLEVTEWDADFLTDLRVPVLLELTIAAAFLRIRALFEMCKDFADFQFFAARRAVGVARIGQIYDAFMRRIQN